jgi:lipid-A-disaccharide synthase
VALLPGSRPGEIERLLPDMARAAARIERAHPGCGFVLPVAPTLERAFIERHLAGAPPISLVEGEAPLVMSAADVCLVCSGTATLEAAILKRPMVVVYRASSLSYHLARRLIRVPFISLPNLLAAEEIVPELIQHEAEPGRMAAEVLKLLADPSAQVERLSQVRGQLGEPGAAGRAAAILASMIGQGAGQEASRG